MKSFILFLIIMLAPLINNAQHQTTIGADFGVIFPKFELYDLGGKLKNGNLPSEIYGFNISQGIYKNLSLEAGYNYFTIYGGPNFKFSYGSGGGNILDVYQFPLSLKYNFPIVKNKITGDVNFGIINCINASYNSYGQGSMTYISAGDTGKAKYFERVDFHRYFPMIEAGLGFNFRLFEDLYFSLNTSYQKGFLKVIEEEIYYQYNSQPVQLAWQISRGNNFQVLLGLKYPVSNVWQKVEERKASKPERMKKLDDAYAKRFYLSVESGPLWRSFIETNPDVFHAKFNRYNFWGFVYADFVFGLNAGMRFYKNFTIESGINFQNYSDRIYYNIIDSVSGGKSYRFDKSALYEIPIRFKYQFQLPAPFKRLFIVPTVGINILHSRINNNYKSIARWEDNYNWSKDSMYIIENYTRPRTNNITLSTGLEIDYFVSPKLIFNISGNLSFGFNEFNKISANYTYLNNSYTGDIIFKGSSQRIMIGLKVPFDFR